ncbi:MAG: hypothetical protein KKF62_05160 [Bacteroidetes bacterium]|nr:hypothetical protein [Bacteroidota bacterium]MBU1117230.1 hypothetical protein [Bacteroidota bacterium]MBU1800294.1 hypothetical protein [Bacteroidota bacterium]
MLNKYKQNCLTCTKHHLTSPLIFSGVFYEPLNDKSFIDDFTQKNPDEGENGSSIVNDSANNEYNVVTDGSGKSNFSFENISFNFKSFRAYLVFKYELLPGSIL